MPTVSVKLADATKATLDRLAASMHITPHALMVQAIESRLESEKKHGEFVSVAQQSLRQTRASGKAYDGAEYLAYVRARLQGKKLPVPRLKTIATQLKSVK